jgi:hypothetical protein
VKVKPQADVLAKVIVTNELTPIGSALLPPIDPIKLEVSCAG